MNYHEPFLAIALMPRGPGGTDQCEMIGRTSEWGEVTSKDTVIAWKRQADDKNDDSQDVD